MRTVTLEILRHGPPHNQLLSPLTQYMALCGNMPASTLELPFEHAEFLLRFRNLQYKESADARILELQETARTMSNVLGKVPGLIRELKEDEGRAAEVIHLRLILSANELALLPFELANAPYGCPGAGQPLVLQSQCPISLTREVRRVSSEENTPVPSDPPRILFAAASPGGPVPFDAHLLAIRRAIAPWVRSSSSDQERRQRVRDHLTILPRATLKQVEDECATGGYTHVHILAHGRETEYTIGKRFGLALHDSGDPRRVDVVEGDRLAKALRTHEVIRDTRFTLPRVVSIAACNAGDIGSVVGAGASIAHALHEEGIPLVIASQFPLSFAGSVVLADVLYKELLWGTDPRHVIVHVRRALRAQVPDTHDWGSVVNYASFPSKLGDQLRDYRFRQAYGSLEAVLSHYNRAIRGMSSRTPKAQSETAPQSKLELDRMIEPHRKQLHDVRLRLESLIKEDKGNASICGLVASAEKRVAEILWRAKAQNLAPDVDRDVDDSLKRACDYYTNAFDFEPRDAWGLVQGMALRVVLGGLENLTQDKWNYARLTAQNHLDGKDRQKMIWAYSDLVELHVLAVSKKGAVGFPSVQKCENLARRYIGEVIRFSDPTGWDIYSNRGQLLRYCEFFNLKQPELAPSNGIAAELWDKLPEPQVHA
jgi:hypothetical protein